MFYITEKNWNKLLGYAEEAYETEKSEIGGMSVMVKDKDDDWVLQDPVILQQEISAGNTVLDKDALAVYYTKQAKKMGKKEFRFCWWHSHHTMAAFWSGTDLKAINEYSDGDFSFALVINLKGEYKFRTSIWKPFEVHQDVELDIMRPARCNKHMKKEVENLCSKHSYSYSWKKPGSSYRGYRSIDQIEEEESRQERLPFHTTPPDIESYDRQRNAISYSDIMDEVDDLISEVIDGTITYNEYSIQTSDLNRRLTLTNSSFKVKLVEEPKIPDLLHMFPSELIVYKDTEMALYDESYHYGGY